MRNRFMTGLFWGSMIGTVLGAIIGPMAKPQKKPLVSRGADAIKATTKEVMHEARRARKKILKKL